MEKAVFETFLAALAKSLATPSETLPSVQWIAEPRLIRLLMEIKCAVGIPKAMTGQMLLQRLVDSKLARPLVMDDVPAGGYSHRIYWLSLGAMPEIMPIELLASTQSSIQGTAICYFTALQFHELTTQVAPHHHIATQKKSNTSVNTHIAASNNLPKLGTLLFVRSGVPYYRTNRDISMTPGVQRVRVSPTCEVAMTTLEQTMLDCLQKPWHCGGAEVVFEAWERGLPVADERNLCDLLVKIGRIDLTRRVGYLLDVHGHVSQENGLRQILNDAKAGFLRGALDVIPLIAGTPEGVVDKCWGISG